METCPNHNIVAHCSVLCGGDQREAFELQIKATPDHVVDVTPGRAHDKHSSRIPSSPSSPPSFHGPCLELGEGVC